MSDPSDRDSALATLAAAVRGLIDATVTVDTAPETLRAFAARVDRLADELRADVPEAKPPRYAGGGGDPADVFPYDCVMGKWNPLAAPLTFAWRDPLAVATARFGSAYEGPPGCVHGAAIAAAFDQVLNVANLMSGTAGPTARLTIHYRRPTPLHRVLRFEGWVARRDGNKIHGRGRLLADDQVTVEAEGLYIVVDVERVMRLLDR